jgi:hypothetical protein
MSRSFGPNKTVIDRRRKVLRLRYVKRYKAEDIAEMLDISMATVGRDIVAIRKYALEQGGEAMQLPVEEVVFELCLNYDERQTYRWQEYSTLGPKFQTETDPATGKQETKQTHVGYPRIRTDLLVQIQADETEHVKTLQSLGALPKVADKHEVEEKMDWATLAALAIGAGMDEAATDA